MIVATTRAALLRGSSTDGLGDEVDEATIVPGFEDFPISIIERDGTEFDQASSTWRSIRKLIGRVSAAVPVNEGDRIKDLRTVCRCKNQQTFVRVKSIHLCKKLV